MKKTATQKRVKASQGAPDKAGDSSGNSSGTTPARHRSRKAPPGKKTSGNKGSKASGKQTSRKAAPAANLLRNKRAGGKKKVTARRGRCSRLSPAAIEEIFARFRADTPEPKSELHYSNPYTLLVAVALSAQATDAGVNKATRELFKRVDTPEKMLELGEDALREQIKTIGLFRNKARNAIAMSRMLVEDYGGQVPDDREALERLPGVGRKTANVVLNVAFGEPTIAVDTHLFRVANRTGLAPGKDPLGVELCLLKVVPQDYLLHAHHWLILHGRHTCVARKPKCPVCIISDLCKFKDKTKLT